MRPFLVPFLLVPGLMVSLVRCGGITAPWPSGGGSGGSVSSMSNGPGGARAACDEKPVSGASCNDEGARCGPYTETEDCSQSTCGGSSVYFDSYLVCQRARWEREDELHSGCCL
jgi:hypothetical protein